MKTMSDLINHSNSIKNQMREENLTKRQYSKLNKELLKLKEFSLYLETSPNESFLVSEKNRIEKLILSKENQYKNWSASVCPDNVEVKKRRQLFNKEIGILNLKNHLQLITYLLT